MNKIQMLTTVKLESSASLEHPNKQPYRGILCSIGSASTKAPIGSKGKLVVLSAEGAVSAIDTLKGMPLNATWESNKGKFTGHQQTTVIGIIEDAWIQESDVWIEGYLFPQNYPAICASVKEEKEDLGFSYEILASKSETKDNTMTVNEFTFIGACILYKVSAAYGEDTQLIAAQINNEKDGNTMTPEEMKTCMAEMMGMMKEMMTEMDSKVMCSVAEIKAEVEKSNIEIVALTASLDEAKATILASAVVVEPVAVIEDPVIVVASIEIPAPTILAAGQIVVPNGDFADGQKDKKTKIAEIYAGSMSMQEKMRAVVRINAEIE